MKDCVMTCTLLLLTATFAPRTSAQEKHVFDLVKTISIPDLKGRIDHMAVDVPGQRLFIAGLENGTVEVVDLHSAKWLQSIPGFKKPQGIVYVSALKKLIVASGDDGMVRVFRGDTLQLLTTIHLDLGANRLVYDPERKLLYVGYGGKDAGKTYGEVAVIDVATDQKVADIQVTAHPSELLLDSAGQRLFAFISVLSQVQVVDTASRKVVATWPVSSQRNGDGAIEDSAHRLFLGTHTPPRMIVMDSRTGEEIASLPTVEGMDGVFFDAARHRIYVSGGRENATGNIVIYQQQNADHYQTLATIPTRAGAGTSFWSPELNRYYVAAPSGDQEQAAILVFAPEP
jgi:DNA-binding beta-propeller fold protein YncE